MNGVEPHPAGLRLGSRRRAIAAVTSAVAAVALAAAIAGRGCRAADESPEGALRALATAARAGDRDAVYHLLGPATRAHLETAARRAGEVAGGERRFSPLELLGVSAALDQPAPADFVVRRRDGARAVVEVVGPSGERAPFTAVKIDGRWRIELLPDPPAP